MRNIKKIQFYFLSCLCVFTLFFTSCKTTRKLATDNIKPLSLDKIVRKVEKESPSYKSLESKKVMINYNDSENKIAFTGQLKIDNSNCIIVNLKKSILPIGRCYITNDSVSFVNQHERYYIQDDITSTQKVFGVDISYNLLQAMVTADVSALLNNELKDLDLSASTDEKMYRIDSHLNNKISKAINSGNTRRLNKYKQTMAKSEFNTYTAWIDPEFFVIKKLILNNIKTDEKLTINYDEYEVVGRNLFPKNISLLFDSNKQNISIDLKLTKPILNKVKSFKFSIPSKYEQFYFSKN